jgi:hypothetical protein
MINIDAGKIFIPRLTITDSERTTITIIPEDKYFVDKKYIVIFYKITLINDNGQVDVKIPYYMSDGGTNGVRINALLPFMCFNNKMIDSGCPISQDKTNGLLFKYKVCQNIKFDKMTQKIKNACFEIQDKSLAEKIKKEDMYQLIALLKNPIGQTGPYSFLPRIENVLDFLICLSSNKIKNINDTDLSTQKKYIPNYTERDRVKIFYEDNEILNGIMEKNEELFNSSSYELSSCALVKQQIANNITSMINSVKTCYRHFLIQKLKELYDLLLEGETKVCKVEYTELNELKIISIQDFNKLTEICKDSKITEVAEQNYNNYNTISGELLKIFITKISNPIFNSTIVKDIEILQICSINTLKENLVEWNAKCGKKRDRIGGYYEKYLKYKNKYLDLKKLII